MKDVYDLWVTLLLSCPEHCHIKYALKSAVGWSHSGLLCEALVLNNLAEERQIGPHYEFFLKEPFDPVVGHNLRRVLPKNVYEKVSAHLKSPITANFIRSKSTWPSDWSFHRLGILLRELS